MRAFFFHTENFKMFLPSLVAFLKKCFTSTSEYSGPKEYSSTSSISNFYAVSVVHVLLHLFWLGFKDAGDVAPTSTSASVTTKGR